jgi:hypothetical protein
MYVNVYVNQARKSWANNERKGSGRNRWWYIAEIYQNVSEENEERRKKKKCYVT